MKTETTAYDVEAKQWKAEVRACTVGETPVPPKEAENAMFTGWEGQDYVTGDGLSELTALSYGTSWDSTWNPSASQYYTKDGIDFIRQKSGGSVGNL